MEHLNKNNHSKLFVYSGVDSRDDEEKYERCYQFVHQRINGLSDKLLHDLLTKLVCKDKQHEEVSIGLLYIILTDPPLAAKTYRDLTLITRDGLNFCTNQLAILVAEKFQKLSDIGRRQLLWLLRELIKNLVPNVENFVWNCIRQAAGGDISPRNLLFVEGLLDIFNDYRSWLEKHHYLIGAVVYSYVRLIEDHNNPMQLPLRNKEVKFTIGLIRDRFTEIIPLGRDFVRLLQNVAKIPEFDQLWRDILFNPKSLCPQFLGVWQLLQTRTSRRFIQCRLTPEVERKLHFLTTNVKFGSHKRYQDWFQDKYFSTPESHSLRSDLIRFIINVIHPTNDMLCSDIIPRWAIIGWLLTSCTNPIAQSNAKLALFYDWLFFDPIKDNIMNIEPGILVMYHSIRSHPLVSSTLLDFLCRIIKNFHPKNEDKIRAGVYNSLRKILEKQVIPNLHPLFESPKLDRELRNLIRENFREFCTHPNNVTTAITQQQIIHDPSLEHRNNLPSITHNNLLHHITPSSIHPQPQQPKQPTQPTQPKQPTQPQQPQQPKQPTQPQQPQHSTPHIISHTHESPTPEEIKLQMLQPTKNMKISGIAAHGLQLRSGKKNNSLKANSIPKPEPKPKPKDDEKNKDKEPDATFSDDDDDDDDIKPKICSTEGKNDDLTDEDDDLPLSKVRLKEKPVPEKIDLPASIQDSFDKFITQKNSHTFELFLNDYRTLTPSQALDQEQQNYVIANITLILKETLPSATHPLNQPTNSKNNSANEKQQSKLKTSVFPESKSDEKLLSESISYPIFYLFRQMYQYDNEKAKQKLRDLVTILQKMIPSTGYLLIYFLKVYTKLQSRKNSSVSYPFKIQLYKQICDAFNNSNTLLNNNINLSNLLNDNKDNVNNNSSNNSNTKPISLEKLLLKDLDCLEMENTQIFLWLVPDIYREFKQYVLNNSSILHIILRCIDAKNLRDLIYNITLGKLKLFKVEDGDGLLDLIRDSFQYETFEQFCLWQLIQAHDVPIATLQEILPELDPSENAEALTYMLFLLKKEKPTTELIRLLLSRETKSHRGDSFVTSALRYWCQEYEESLSEIIANLLNSKYPNSSPNKRKRQLKSQSAINTAPSADQLLSHLEHFRRSCRYGNGTGTGLYVQDAMQRALQQAYAHSTDTVKKQYSDLFALAAEDEPNVGRRGGSSRGRKQANKKDSNTSNSNSKKNVEPVNKYSSEESSNEEWAKPKQSKRRKKIVDSDDSD